MSRMGTILEKLVNFRGGLSLCEVVASVKAPKTGGYHIGDRRQFLEKNCTFDYNNGFAVAILFPNGWRSGSKHFTDSEKSAVDNSDGYYYAENVARDACIDWYYEYGQYHPMTESVNHYKDQLWETQITHLLAIEKAVDRFPVAKKASS